MIIYPKKFIKKKKKKKKPQNATPLDCQTDKDGNLTHMPKLIYLQTNPDMLRPHKSTTHKHMHMHDKTIPLASHRRFSPQKKQPPQTPYSHLCSQELHMTIASKTYRNGKPMPQWNPQQYPQSPFTICYTYVSYNATTKKASPKARNTTPSFYYLYKKTHDSYKLQLIALACTINKIFTNTYTTLLVTFEETHKILHCRQEGFHL